MSQYTFDTASGVSMRRSRLNQGHRVKTSMRVGDLVPIDVREVLPGDNWTTKEGHLVRLSTSYLRPVMDTAFMDVYEFFVPLRLLYDETESVFGNPSPNAYVQEDLGKFPTFEQITVPEKTVGDYLGLPTNGLLPQGISVLKFRAFALIYDVWFRNQNTISPMLVQRGEVTASENPNNDPWSPSNYSGKLPKVGKKNDYFTSCLPSPQKGEAVSFSLGGKAPLIFPDTVQVGGSPTFLPVRDTGGLSPMLIGLRSSTGGSYQGRGPLSVDSGNIYSPAGGDIVSSNPAYATWGVPLSNARGENLAYADLSNLSAINVNDLRFAFQLQKMLERDARGGGRYFEYILAHYGVRTADSRMQIPEYLGGKRTPLNLQQVAQTSQGTEDSPLGSLGGYSQTLGRSGYRKAFSEHGFIFTIACIRYEHSYQQGIDKSFFRSRREDFYDPLFANIGEQPVYRSQIYGYANANSTGLKSHAFGYQEAWAEYRYAPDIVTGEMRSNAKNSFDVYHFADNYEGAPVLNEQFTNENGEFFRRTTAVDSEADVDDFIVDFYFDSYAYRVMPVRSIPGLIDHH